MGFTRVDGSGFCRVLRVQAGMSCFVGFCCRFVVFVESLFLRASESFQGYRVWCRFRKGFHRALGLYGCFIGVAVHFGIGLSGGAIVVAPIEKMLRFTLNPTC